MSWLGNCTHCGEPTPSTKDPAFWPSEATTGEESAVLFYQAVHSQDGQVHHAKCCFPGCPDFRYPGPPPGRVYGPPSALPEPGRRYGPPPARWTPPLPYLYQPRPFPDIEELRAPPSQPKPDPRPPVPKSIYLAGKIGKNDWRHDIVQGLHYQWGQMLQNDLPEPPWPVLQGAVGGCLDYTGPYFATDDHGCFHGPMSHGCATCQDGYTPLPRQDVRNRCLDAIRRSDLIFAWIDSLDGYGTLAEIGYAYALGKKILIATPGPPDFSCNCGHCDHGTACSNRGLGELWFAFSMATAVIRAADPRPIVLGLAAEAARHQLPGNASAIEKQFWAAHLELALPALKGLVPQHPVLRYRIDFALPARKTGIELDGFASHSSTADIARDRKRQRDLEAEGWYLIRFGGSEVHRDAAGCVRQAARLVEMRGRAS